MPAVREAELYSLPEVARATGIPLPDLQRLRRDHADELPSVVVGEAKRYPDEALAVFRRLHRQGGGDGDELRPVRAPVEPRRALFSLSAQRRGGDERSAADGRRGDGAARQTVTPEPATAAPAANEPPAEVVDPGPPNVFDEMALALGQLGDDEREVATPVAPKARPVGERGPAGERWKTGERRTNGTAGGDQPRRHPGGANGDRRPAAAPEPGSLAAAIERVRAAKAVQTNRPQSAALHTDGGRAAAAGPVAEPAVEATNGRAAGGADAEAEAAAGTALSYASPPAAADGQTAVKSEAPEAEIARPTPPLYTLQQIHERTGIPYSTLSLLAASHAAEIPSAGERYSPAYPLAGLQAFCRIYGERNPGWEAPPLGPEPGWDDDDGIAARIAALEAVQNRWSDQLDVEIDRFARPWNGQAEWEA